jgi:hypothetical protein
MTNKTDKNSRTTRAGTQPQIELASTDTNPSAARQMPKLDFTRRQANRQLPTPQLLQLLHDEAPDLWQLAKVVGNWVWIAFSQKQPRQITGTLSAFGFSWNRARQSWQHPCGDIRSRAASYDPRRRYGSRPAAEIQTVNGGQSHD